MKLFHRFGINTESNQFSPLSIDPSNNFCTLTFNRLTQNVCVRVCACQSFHSFLTFRRDFLIFISHLKTIHPSNMNAKSSNYFVTLLLWISLRVILMWISRNFVIVICETCLIIIMFGHLLPQIHKLNLT